MNLFVLDLDHDKNAEYHVDKHVVKMILEACEMLCMAHWVQEELGFVPRKLDEEEYAAVNARVQNFKAYDPVDRHIPYTGRPAHLNHPCTIWVRSSLENYNWTYCYAAALEMERKYRYPNGVDFHRGLKLVNKMKELTIPDKGLTPFALAMKAMQEKRPDLYLPDDAVQSYRNFYMVDKGTFASWKNRPKPPWWQEELANYNDRVSSK